MDQAMAYQSFRRRTTFYENQHMEENLRFRDIPWTFIVLLLLGLWIGWGFQISKYTERQTPAQSKIEEILEREVRDLGQKLSAEAKVRNPYTPEQYFRHLRRFEIKEAEIIGRYGGMCKPSLTLHHWRDQVVLVRDEKWRGWKNFDWEKLDLAREKYEKWHRSVFPEEYSFIKSIDCLIAVC